MMRLFILMLMWAPCAGAVEPVFWSDTETELKDTVSAPAGLIQFVLRGEDSDDNRSVHECMQEEKLKKGEEAALFTVSRVSLKDDQSPGYFVRPALKPFCSTFYGAHLFRYWFVTSAMEKGRLVYRMAFKDGGDGAGVLPTSTNGYKDLLLYSHDAASEYWVTLAFDGREYKEKDCERKDFQEDGSLKSMPCRP